MRRRGFLTTVVAVGTGTLGGCSGEAGEGTPTVAATETLAATLTGRPTATETATRTPADTDTAHPTEEPTPTASLIDPAEAAQHIEAARGHLAVAVKAFDAVAVSIPEVPVEFAYDTQAVADALAAARDDLDVAAHVGTADQRAVAGALSAFVDAVGGTGQAHGATVAAAESLVAAWEHESRGENELDGEHREALADFEAAGSFHDGAVLSLAAARNALDEYESRAKGESSGSEPSLPVEALHADLAAVALVVATLGVLTTGGAAKVHGVLDLEAGIAAFRDAEYSRSARVLGDAIGHFEAAADALTPEAGEGGSDFVGERVGVERCRVERYRDGTTTIQSGALEASAGNTSEGFDLYRDGLSVVRSIDQYC